MFESITQAQKQHQARLQVFREEMPSSLSSEIKTLSTLGRSTVIEFCFFDALTMDLIHETARGDQVNQVVAKMDGAKLGIDDINSTLWAFCSKVVQGTPLDMQ